MPTRNRRKIYVPRRFYHIYNRGVNKQAIFHRQKDYIFYYHCIKEYLTPKKWLIKEIHNKGYKEKTINKKLSQLGWIRNYYTEITLVAFCLMPNHIHLVVKQEGERSISSFMQSLHTRYGKYHKKYHSSSGPLFEDRFKARLIQDTKDLLKVTRYVHLNPKNTDPFAYRWSSLPYYKSKKKPIWINTKIIQEEFAKSGFTIGYKSYLDWIKDGPFE